MTSDKGRMELIVNRMNHLNAIRGVGKYKEWDCEQVEEMLRASENYDGEIYTGGFGFKRTKEGYKITFSGYWRIKREHGDRNDK